MIRTLVRMSNVIYQKNWKVGLESFAFRQFDDPNYTGSKIEFDKTEFITKVNEMIDDSTKFHDGYAPFCKHIFVENFTSATPSCVAITEENRAFIESDYVARRPEELPVLVRWLPRAKAGVLPKAKYLDLIMYSKEQCIKESASMGGAPIPEDAPDWLVISIKSQNEPYETPMTPITMMRNTLISEGGSGVEIDRQKYMDSAAYWKNHVMLQ